jgi:hypothetical protein
MKSAWFQSLPFKWVNVCDRYGSARATTGRGRCAKATSARVAGLGQNNQLMSPRQYDGPHNQKLDPREREMNDGVWAYGQTHVQTMTPGMVRVTKHDTRE